MNKKRLQKLEPFFAVSKHRANRIFHKFTFSSWLQQILILGDSSQRLCSGIMDKMTFAKPFGDMLKEKRKLRGLSQMGLAMKSGRSLRCIQYLEAGTQEPTLSTLYAIAHALDLRVMDLIEALPEELNDMYN